MTIVFNFITGFVVGFDIAPAPGIYVVVSLGIVEIAFFNDELVDEL